MPSPKPFGDSNRYQEVGVELTSFGEDEEDDEVDLFTAQRYLDIKAVTAVVDKFKINRKGYKGIVVYSIFVSLLFVVMFQQRDNANIGIEERESIGETELLPLFKKAMKSEYPVSDGKLGVMCEWILEHYGRIRCEFKTTGVMSEHDINIVRKIFNGHDLDRSGTIGSKEFGQCLCELKHPLGNDINYVQASLAVVDVDKSGEIEWEEFLMFVASESGKSVPPKLLPEHMQKNQDKILAEYAKHKDKTLNDASDSIWDSTDAMSSSATKASSVSGTTPAAAPAKAASTAAPKAIEKLYKNMLAAIEDNGESLQVIKDMIVPPENELSKFM